MQPEGFVDPKGANKVSKLQRSIYGLVQASQELEYTLLWVDQSI